MKKGRIVPGIQPISRQEIKIRHIIWQYLAKWSKVQAPLNGDALKQMSYKPSPQYKIMLDVLLKATLDGEISKHSTATDFLKELKIYDHTST